jgi:exopolysaccharide biosynthesis polyprenyl glycosylphosphotransferase
MSVDLFGFQRAHSVLGHVSDNRSQVHIAVAADDERLVVKRLLDIAIASTALLFLAPLMLTIAILIKLQSNGPVFFVQERYGLHKRRFRMLKFRTMVVDAEALQAKYEANNEAQGPVFKIRNDPRMTGIGPVLRRTSLDELPQFINVLAGNMSLVGPRPLPARDVLRFEEPWLMRRFSVKPGLTCLWQINGRSDVGFDKWIRLDLEYIDNWSLALDLRILALTVPAVIRGAGAA